MPNRTVVRLAIVSVLLTTAAVTIWAAHHSLRAGRAPLAQSTSTFTLALNAPMDRAFPMFGPVREAEWAPGWAPTFLYPAEGAQRGGTVFTTAGGHGLHAGTQLWVLTDYDATAGRVDYVVLSAGVAVVEIKIRLAPDGPQRSRATVAYRRTALAPAANEHVAGFTRQWESEQQAHWQQAINLALEKERRD